jgi:hypothetical protein
MNTRLLFVLLIALTLTGCETARQDFTTGVREKFSGPTYRQRVYAADTRAVFDAARATAARLGFRITRSGFAQGVIEGVTALDVDSRLKGTRQQTIKVRLAATLDGGTEVSVLFTEIVEDDFEKGAGLGTETALRNHPIYESFLGGLGDVLKP